MNDGEIGRAGTAPAEPPARTRRPTSARRRELVATAAGLFAARGYNAVTVDDVCEALGLTGPALYRHFRSKEALLVAVFDQVIGHQSGRIRDLLTESADPASALDGMVRLHVEFVAGQRVNLNVWRQEFHHLPAADRQRLRRAQRLYLEDCVHIVAECRPDLAEAETRALTHGIVALLQSPADFVGGITPEPLMNLLLTMAVAAVYGGTTGPMAWATGSAGITNDTATPRPMAATTGS